MDEPGAPIDPTPPAEPSAVPTPPPRTVSLRTALTATLAGVLLAFGVGYAINAADAGAASERDELSEELDRVVDARDGAQASLTVAEGAVDECQAAVLEGAALAEEASDFAGDWQHLSDLWLQYFAAPVGSAEEAEIDLRMTELSMQMDTKVGALAASADRVTADATCRET